jgi:hypothetical protein
MEDAETAPTGGAEALGELAVGCASADCASRLLKTNSSVPNRNFMMNSFRFDACSHTTAVEVYEDT